ncbi:hypothetical protein PG997_012916 [Apiospora hydei]|uniref:Uncharacterized protein n=1 Tax=Apiospora hydei TaxID=1337664 RepID=A0ABR1V7X2_9PEZI
MDRSGSFHMSGPTHTRKPRLRLLPLYGNSSREEAVVRQFKNGLLKDDKFASSEAWVLPPGFRLLLVMFNRFHNYIASGLLAINESNRFPMQFHPTEKDEALYQLARRITCRLYINMILNDYLRTLLGVNRANADWYLQLEALTRRALPQLSKPSKTSPNEANEAAISLIIDNWWKNAFSEEDNDYMATRCSRSTGRAKPPKEDAAVSSTDEEMSHKLRRSAEDIASAYSTNRVPIAFRDSQIKTIARAREKQLPTLNNFRQMMGLPVHKTFEDINTSPLVTAKLRALYAHPDEVELYPGMVAEQPPSKVMFATTIAGKWLWTGSTVTHAVVRDTLALIRGDQFYTDDWIPRGVTNWGYHEPASDKKVNYGCVMHKLFLRAFPNHFSADSVFAHFPFVTSDGNRAILARLGSDAYYSFEAADRNTSAPTIFSLEATKGSAQFYGEPLGLTGVLETSNAMLPNASKQLRSVVSRTPNSPSHKPIEIDLVEEVIAPYVLELFCSQFSMNLSRTESDGFLTTAEGFHGEASSPLCEVEEGSREKRVERKIVAELAGLPRRGSQRVPGYQDGLSPADGRRHLKRIQELSLGMNDGHPNCARTTGFQVLHYLLEGYRLYLATDGRSFWRKLTTWSPTFINVSASARNNDTYPDCGALVLDRDLESYESIGLGKALLNLLSTRGMLALFLELATFSRWKVVNIQQGLPRRINIAKHHWGITGAHGQLDLSGGDWDLVDVHEEFEDDSWVAISDGGHQNGDCYVMETRESYSEGEVTVYINREGNKLSSMPDRLSVTWD